LFVNVSVWGMLLSGKIVRLDPSFTSEPSSWLRQLVSRLGESTVRAAMLQAMRFLGRHFVLGRTIEEALKRGSVEYLSGTSFSFDMLGEGARTALDAERYLAQYEQAINVVGGANKCN